MKRILLTILTVFYLGVASGATVHFHYCMGELVRWTLNKPDQAVCEFCAVPKKSCEKSCCKEGSKQAKIDKSHQTTDVIYQFKQAPVALLNKPAWNFTVVSIPLNTGNSFLNKAPPITEDIPVFIRNCTFRI